MSLRFVIGSSGSGKSTYIYKKIIEASMEDMRRSFLVIVPEQFTLETQRLLVSLHPAHSILNIDILSFDRLAHRVFDEFCESGLTLIDDTGKNLILRRVAEDISDDLLVLGSRIKSPGYIDQVKSLLSEFEQYNIDADGIEALSGVPGVSPAFKSKIHDLLLIHNRYMEYIKEEHITAEQRYERLSVMLPDSKLLRDAVVVLDGYTGFTPIQNVLLSQVLSLAKEVYVTATMDVREPAFGGREHELFWMTKKMIKSLTGIARDAGVETGEPILIGVSDASRFIPGGRLAHLEKKLFSDIRISDGPLKYEAGTAADDEIRIARLDSPREELAFAASQIRRMIAKSMGSDKPYTYSDFAIVSGAPETYEPYLGEVFSEYDIPVFSDSKTQAAFQPCFEFIMSALSVLRFDFRYDDVVGVMRTGLMDYPVPDIDLFDHFLYRTGIRGRRRFLHTFTIRPREFSEDEHTRINEIRAGLMESFKPLLECFYDVCDVSVKTDALRRFLLGFSLSEKLKRKSEEYEAAGDAALAMEYASVYDSVMELLDRMDAMLPGVSMDGEEFAGLFAAGLESVSLGVIPQDYDRVIFGDIERTRLSNIKWLFLIGANDGVIPQEGSSPNIFSQNERMVLKDAGVELAPTVRERSFMQRFYLYELLTKGSRGLFITCSRLDADGTSLRPSYIISEIKRYFPDISEEAMDRDSAPGYWTSTIPEARETFIMLLRRFLDTGELSGKRAQIFGLIYGLLSREDGRELSRILDAAFYVHRDEAVTKAVMHAINGDEMNISVSRLERYAACEYADFLNHSLRLKERKEPDFEYGDMGTLYHQALDIYSRMIHDDGRSWRDVDEDEQEAYLEKAVDRAYEAAARTEIMEGARERYIITSMKKTLRRTIWAIHRQVRGGDFEPERFEVQLSEIGRMEDLSYELSDGTRLNMSGQIDRIDTCEKGDRIFVKILDYKSGSRSIDLLSMYHGLQIQLVFYMNAAVEGMQKKEPQKEIVPAAFFYYHIDDPVVDAKSGITDEELSDMQIKSLRPTGGILGDMDIVSALDKGVSEAAEKRVPYKSDMAKIELKKDGSLSSRSEVVSREDMALMRKYVSRLVRSSGESMISGRIAVSPYRMGDRSACTYCPYHQVCGFDVGLPGYEYRSFTKIDKDEIMESMKRAVEKDTEAAGEDMA